MSKPVTRRAVNNFVDRSRTHRRSLQPVDRRILRFSVLAPPVRCKPTRAGLSPPFPPGPSVCHWSGLLENAYGRVRSDLTRGRIAKVILCVVDEEMVLLHGSVKKTQKTPKSDLHLALKRMLRGQAMKEKTIGSSFDSFLREEGIDEQVTSNAIKRVLARQAVGGS